MTNLITLERAKREIERLQKFVDLVEGYKVHSLESWIIKEYANTNSMVKVAGLAKSKGSVVGYSFRTSLKSLSVKPSSANIPFQLSNGTAILPYEAGPRS